MGFPLAPCISEQDNNYASYTATMPALQLSTLAPLDGGLDLWPWAITIGLAPEDHESYKNKHKETF